MACSLSALNRTINLPTNLTELLSWLLDTLGEIQKAKLDAAQGLEYSPLWELADAAELSFSWAELYELPLSTFVILFLVAFGGASELLSVESVEEVVGLLRRIVEDSDEPDFFEHLGEPTVHLSQLMFVVGRCADFNLKAVSIYFQSINDLVERVRQGNDDAFFNAVRIDPSVIQAPTIARRLAFAHMGNEATFLDEYRKAVSDGPETSRLAYSDLRLVLKAVDELQGLVKLPRAEIHQAVVNDLRLYGKKDSDTFKNLFALMDSWKRESTK